MHHITAHTLRRCSSAGNRSTGGTVISAKKPPTARGAAAHELPVEAQHLRRLLDRPERRPGHHRRPHRMGLELKLGDHPEVAAAAAQRPEQVGVLVGAGVHQRAVGEHHVGPDEAVDRQPEAACQMPETAAEREPANPGRRDDPRRRRAPVLGRRAVDLPPGGATPHADRAQNQDRRSTCAISARSITIPSSTIPSPPPLCPPPRTAIGASFARAERDTASHVLARWCTAPAAPDACRSSRCERHAPRRSRCRRGRRSGH